MTKNEQRKYVNALCDRIKLRLTAGVASFPEHWDGRHILTLTKLVTDEICHAVTDKKIVREAKNEYIVRNL